MDGTRIPLCVISCVATAALTLAAACTDNDDDSADAVICEAVASVDADASEVDAADAVERIKTADPPASDLLASVREGVFAEGNQLALPVRFEDLMSECDEAGVELDLPTERASGGDLCTLVNELGQQREADVTNADTIEALVDALPANFREDAALFYYPYGGDVPSDADGLMAEQAGARLYSYYEDNCGYTGP